MADLKFIICIFLWYLISVEGIHHNKVVVLKGNITLKTLLQELKTFGLSFVEQLIPNLYIFVLDGTAKRFDEAFVHKIKESLKNKILNIEWVVDEEISVNGPIQRTRRSHAQRISIQDEYEHNYGMGVPDAWTQGYTGNGVVVAVTGVGVDIEHPDLTHNINLKLSKNCINEGLDVRPNKYPDFPETLEFTDHENRCAGLIAATKGNTMCSSGIAYKATMAVMKIFKVDINKGGMISYSNDAILKGLIYKTQDIHIYSNSWTMNKPFKSLAFSAKEVINYGIKYGRNGKGSIYVFPVGKVAEGFTNSKYSITVGSIGINGSIAEFSIDCACVLISTLGEGTHLHSDYIETTSHNVDKCTRDFKGPSASTAMVSAMIALALEANPELSWRDVQHILVRSSSNKGLQEMMSFKKNGAGYYYHQLFGFGILNANDLVMLAKEWIPVKQQISQTYRAYDYSQIWHQDNSLLAKAKIHVNCSEETLGSYIEHIEHAEVKLAYMTPNEHGLKITLVSPARTHSILMEKGQSIAKNVWRKDVNFLSVNFWDESSCGEWVLMLHQHKYGSYEGNNRCGIISFTLTISGTLKYIKNEPQNNFRTYITDNNNLARDRLKRNVHEESYSCYFISILICLSLIASIYVYYMYSRIIKSIEICLETYIAKTYKLN